MESLEAELQPNYNLVGGGLSGIHSKFEASLGSMRPCVKRRERWERGDEERRKDSARTISNFLLIVDWNVTGILLWDSLSSLVPVISVKRIHRLQCRRWSGLQSGHPQGMSVGVTKGILRNRDRLVTRETIVAAYNFRQPFSSFLKFMEQLPGDHFLSR